MIVVGLVLIGGAFYGGMKYDQSQRAAGRNVAFTQFTGGVGGRGGFALRGAGGGFVSGSILSKDAQSITVQLMGTTTATQGSAIVFLSSSTTIMKTTTGSPADLTVGQNVTVVGNKNSDGSYTANTIQLRPANK